jgi:hypothetical protein
MIRNMILAMVLSFCVLVPAAWGLPSQVYMDFDDDDNPWTIRTELPEGVTEAVAKVVLEVGDTIPSGQNFLFDIGFGCCEEGEDVYVGASGLPSFYAYSGFFPSQPTHPWACVFPTPCPGSQCFWQCPFLSDLNVQPGERYFIGAGTLSAICETQPCTPPTTVSFWAFIGGEAVGSGTLTFCCPGASPAIPTTWGSIRNLYR